MRRSLIPTIAVIALLVLAGCTGAPPTGENETRAPPDVSPDEFPDAAEINPSVFEQHATVMGNTSFTLAIQQNRTDRNPDVMDSNFTYYNRTTTTLFDTNDSQFLQHTPGGEVYSNGAQKYRHSEVNNWTKNQSPTFSTSVFNTSGERYLWEGLLAANEPVMSTIAINATYERNGAEWFNGTAVMRYEATGVDALPERVRESGMYANFSATLLLDEDGVIRRYHYTFQKSSVDHSQSRLRAERSYTITDIGTTDVEKPDWVTEFQESE